MGDMTKEPSMEEILSSIKRIIAEEGDEATRGISARAPRRGRAMDAPETEDVAHTGQGVDAAPDDMLSDEILELTDPFELEEAASAPQPVLSPAPEAPAMAQTAKKPVIIASPAKADSAQADAMLSVESEVAARHSLSALSAMVVKPQGSEDNTLEALVRELLRPMMKQWLDDHLPDLVEAMVAKEIARITGRDL